jgi:hypothetical protein
MEFLFLQAWMSSDTLRIPARAGNPGLKWGSLSTSWPLWNFHSWRISKTPLAVLPAKSLPYWRQVILCSTHHFCTIRLLRENRSYTHSESSGVATLEHHRCELPITNPDFQPGHSHCWMVPVAAEIPSLSFWRAFENRALREYFDVLGTKYY